MAKKGSTQIILLSRAVKFHPIRKKLCVFVHKIACIATLFCIKIPAKNILFTGL